MECCRGYRLDSEIISGIDFAKVRWPAYLELDNIKAKDAMCHTEQSSNNLC
ncbi:MAG: hypothetical protein DF168_00154 [Candidatus Moanabacter tarae]|uniref:Uncharacterized protein n=1 Tax=Candidatus Moanibacter tarae TaxID=2200854 RepID=A0A2Z4ANH2_9BACT|nr:MAG: hypothetical protein DF168_00154 [Candidatus Moanabacter tarae]